MLRGGHMKNKKLTAALITAAMIMSVSACSKTTDESKTPEQEPTETTAEATTEASEETSGADESEPSEEETAASTTTAPAFKYVGMTPEEICAQLTLEEKAAQMMQPTCYNVNGNETPTINDWHLPQNSFVVSRYSSSAFLRAGAFLFFANRS